MDLIELIRGKKVMVGAIDVATKTIETPEKVADILRKALQFVDADKLYPCTNCGMAPLPRDVARGKLNALGAGAEIVRKNFQPNSQLAGCSLWRAGRRSCSPQCHNFGKKQQPHHVFRAV